MLGLIPPAGRKRKRASHGLRDLIAETRIDRSSCEISQNFNEGERKWTLKLKTLKFYIIIYSCIVAASLEQSRGHLIIFRREQLGSISRLSCSFALWFLLERSERQ